MIAVDTSALMAILLDEPGSDRLRAALESNAVVISAGTLAEALIVAQGRNVRTEMADLVEALDFEVAPLTARTARLMAEAYTRWGKGFDRAGLNLGDCFAYVTAQELGCALLYVGADFEKTDVASAVQGSGLAAIWGESVAQALAKVEIGHRRELIRGLRSLESAWSHLVQQPFKAWVPI